MKRLLKIFLFASLFGLSLNGYAQASSKSKALIAKHVELAGRISNPDIKFDVPAKDSEIGKPDMKRGGCTISFHNNTGWCIKIYVDSVYRGSICTMQSGNVTTNEGYTTVYCVTFGGTYEWRASGNCDTYYDYNLNIE